MKIIIESKEQRKIPTLHIYNACCREKSPVILILHGYMGKKENHINLAYDYAKSGYYVILFDSFHHGGLKDKNFERLSRLEKDSTIIDIMLETAKFINALIDANINNPLADINRVALIGFSMGGNIIYQYISKMLSKRVKAALMVIGEEDQSVPVDDMIAYCESLRNNYNDKSKVCLEIQKGVGHHVTPESLKKIELWLKKYL